MPRPYVPWKESPVSLGAAALAGMHVLAALLFLSIYFSTPVRGPNGGDRIGVITTFALFSCLFFVLGVVASLFAPGLQRKALLVAANVLPLAGVVVAEVPPGGWNEIGPIAWYAIEALFQGWN